MADKGLSITFEIEPIVKLRCRKLDCVHNLAHDFRYAACNLKHIEIGADGVCADMVQRPQAESRIKPA